MQNCLFEAQLRCSELSGECVPTGEGRFEVRVRVAYFCRSTDAFAGTYLAERRRFPVIDDASAYCEECFRRSGGEDWVELVDLSAPPAPPAPPAPDPRGAVWEDDGIPF